MKKCPPPSLPPQVPLIDQVISLSVCLSVASKVYNYFRGLSIQYRLQLMYRFLSVCVISICSLGRCMTILMGLTTTSKEKPPWKKNIPNPPPLSKKYYVHIIVCLSQEVPPVYTPRYNDPGW